MRVYIKEQQLLVRESTLTVSSLLQEVLKRVKGASSFCILAYERNVWFAVVVIQKPNFQLKIQGSDIATSTSWQLLFRFLLTLFH